MVRPLKNLGDRNGVAGEAQDSPSSLVCPRLLTGTLPSLYVLVCLLTSCNGPPPAKHTISVTFDYDFTATRGCSPTIVTECIARFNVYDVGAGKPVKLFSVPAPPAAHLPVKDISGKSQPLSIGTGKHLLSVSAQMSSGEESDMQQCTAWTFLP